MKLSNLILFFLLSITVTAQKKTTKRYLDSLPNTIENQFTKIFKKGNSWHEYKMIKKTDFVGFQKNILDSVATIKKNIIEKDKIINSQKNTISTLNGEITKINSDLKIALDKEDNISLLGVAVTKTFYNTILFSIIIGLLIALLFFIFRFKNSNSVTREAKKNLKDTEDEFDLYRKKSIEKEQKLRRQLQDEINKQRGV